MNEIVNIMNNSAKQIIWQNTNPAATNLSQFAAELGFADDWDGLLDFSIKQADQFWSKLWDYAGIIGEKGEQIIKNAYPLKDVKFFPQAKLNYAKNLLSGKNEQIAIISYDEKGNRREINFAQLRQLVANISKALINEGVKKGDRIGAIVPNSIEAIAFHLGAASIGAIWSSCSPDFGEDAIIDRLGQIEPKILFCCNGYFYGGKFFALQEKIKNIVAQISSIKRTIIFPFVKNENNFTQNNDYIMFDQWLKPFEGAEFNPVDLPFDHPLAILFSSGTTGKPKCLIHKAGGLLLNHIKEHRLHGDIKNGDRLFYFTTCGWMMWNWQLTALASGARLVLFDGNVFYPEKFKLFEIIAKEKITHFGTSARYIDACQKQNLVPKNMFNLSTLRVIFSTGSPLAPKNFDYVYKNIAKIHLASISGGTDICACFVGGWPVKPLIRGQIQGAMLGMDVDIFDEKGNSILNQPGELVCKNAHPSMPLGFYNDEHNRLYENSYFAKFNNIWSQGDWAIKYANGGFAILGRSDATLNPGGVRIGTAEIYRQIAKIEQIIEAVAVGKQIENDVEIWLFVKLKEGEKLSTKLEEKIKLTIKKGASPRHVPKKIFAVKDIPITRSGKISEIAVRNILDGKEIKNISALANPQSLKYFTKYCD